MSQLPPYVKLPPPPYVVIQFEGICVNFRQVDFPFLPTAHRIVLINASTISNVWNQNISLHTAGFSTELSSSAPSIPLSGATMQISNPLTNGDQPGVRYDPSYYEYMPFLTTVTPGIAGVNMALLLGHNPALASCYFDVDYGVVYAVTSVFGAAMTVVVVQTTGAPTYAMKPFPSGLSWAPIPEVQAQPATSNLYFWNEELDPTEGQVNDFLLSYLVVNWPPGPVPNIPQGQQNGTTPNRKSVFIPPPSPGPQQTTDVGCSNSNYP